MMWRTSTTWGDLYDHPGWHVIERWRIEIDADAYYGALAARGWHPLPGPPDRVPPRASEALAIAVRRVHRHRSVDAVYSRRGPDRGRDVYAVIGGHWIQAYLPTSSREAI